MALKANRVFPDKAAKFSDIIFSTCTHRHNPLCFSLDFYLQPSKCMSIIGQALQSNLECSFGRPEPSGEQSTGAAGYTHTQVLANVRATGRTCLPAVLQEQGSLYEFTTQIQTNPALEITGPINLLQ